MSTASLEARIAAQLGDVGGGDIESTVFGTDQAPEIAASIDEWCGRYLGAGIGDSWLWAVSVGCVAGVELADGQRVVVKAYAPDHSAARLESVRAVQQLAFDAGLAAPRPLSGPFPLGLGLALAETALDVGRRPDLSTATDREVVARDWVRLRDALTSSARPILETGEPPDRPDRVVDGLYPRPHSPIFDFDATSVGAEWIDELASAASAQVVAAIRSDAAPVAVHTDWRSDNVRVSADGRQVVAIYDWDSVHLAPEVRALGEVAAMHSIDWSSPAGPYFATADECVEFARAVERHRPEPFGADEWLAIRGSIVFGWAYTARCEHARAVLGEDRPMFGMRRRLRQDGADLLGR